MKASGEDMTVTGFVSMPACCRGSRSWQFFFVNGRQVKSPLMAAALEQAGLLVTTRREKNGWIALEARVR